MAAKLSNITEGETEKRDTTKNIVFVIQFVKLELII